MTEKTGGLCGGCRWFRKSKSAKSKEGDCYAYPPTVLAMEGGFLSSPHIRHARPRVRIDDTCSLYQEGSRHE